MNIHDIAREAEVSIATVSRVLNGSPAVGEATRQKVQAVIDTHCYTPNALARGLLENRTRTVAILTVDILNPYYATVVNAFERTMNAQGSSTLLCETGGNHHEKQRYIKTLLEKRVDGLVFVGSVYREADGDREILAAARAVPVVMINSRIEAPNVWCVLCDDRRGMELATRRTLEGGGKRILLINTTTTASARLKEEAYFDTLDALGARGAHRGSIEIDRDGLKRLPSAIAEAWKEDPFDSVVAADDLFANVAINTLHSLHVSIPDEVGVIGYNDSYVCEQSYPALSTVDSRMVELAGTSASIITGALSGETGLERITVLEPRLVERSTMRRVPATRGTAGTER